MKPKPLMSNLRSTMMVCNFVAVDVESPFEIFFRLVSHQARCATSNGLISSDKNWHSPSQLSKSSVSPSLSVFLSRFTVLFFFENPMGRAKLQIKYRKNSKARLGTYLTRMKGLKKKAGELSLLCGVDVLVASLSPELNSVQFWPEQDTLEFRRIKERYLRFRPSEKRSAAECTTVERNNGNNDNIPIAAPMPSPSFPLFLEELAAMDVKLKEVRERLRFLQAQAASSSSDAANNKEQVTAPLPALADFTAEDWNWCDSLLDYDEG